jgi:hypothetical protein
MATAMSELVSMMRGRAAARGIYTGMAQLTSMIQTVDARRQLAKVTAPCNGEDRRETLLLLSTFPQTTSRPISRS